jgi:hypothetical protein
MRGTIDGRHIDLIGDHWLNQPANFVMVNLSGTFAEDGRTLTGTAISTIGPGRCSSFAMVN